MGLHRVEADWEPGEAALAPSLGGGEGRPRTVGDLGQSQ